MALDRVEYSLNGQTYLLAKDLSDGMWKASGTAPTKSSFSQKDHKYESVLKAYDQAGNVTTVDRNDSVFGENMLIDVNEKVPPVITPLLPGAGAYLTSHSVEIQFDVTDNDSGVDPDTISLQVDKEIMSGLTKNQIAGGYRCSCTATLEDGGHTLSIGVRDNDGNAAGQKTGAFTVDTVPPELNVPTPADGLITNKQDGVVTGITNDATSAPVTVQIRLNGVDQGAVTVGGNGSFAKNITYQEGVNEIYVKATDRAGKYSEVTLTVICDMTAPVVHSVKIIPNPVGAGEQFTIIADITDE